jgi:tRNA(His) 5'-end guanylyltransferase
LRRGYNKKDEVIQKMSTLKERIDSYKNIFDYKLLPKLPIVICINGKSSSKVTSLLEKPYSEDFSNCMLATMFHLCNDVEGTVFGYQSNDEIVLILRNDQNLETKTWLDNRIQKICSVTSSLASLSFNNHASDLELNLSGNYYFTSQIFTVPNVVEAINALVYKQQGNFLNSIQYACFYELLNRDYDRAKIKEMLTDLSTDEKIELLSQECEIDFHNYPLNFRRGAACYRVSKTNDQDVTKYKWTVNKDLPIFTKDHNFLNNIFKNGFSL